MANLWQKSGKRKKGLQTFICNPLILMVGQDRIELSTHGFSVSITELPNLLKIRIDFDIITYFISKF